MEYRHINITDQKLSVQSCTDFIADDKAGGHNIFIGRVRSSTKDKQVERLEFEAYEKMAASELNKIIDRVIESWPVIKIWVEHRTGTLQIGEEAVIIGVSAPHRDASFSACRFIIDELKKSVPIWKKEVFEDGDIWVAAHP